MRSRSAALALAGLLTLLTAGCGDGGGALSKQQYERKVLQLVRDLQPTATRLFFDVVSTDYPRAECSVKTSRFHAVLEEIVSRVEELDPPREVAGLQRRFLRAANESVDEVGKAANEVRRGRLSCGQPLNRRIYGLPSTDRAERLLEAFQRRGYFAFLAATERPGWSGDHEHATRRAGQ